MMTDRSDNRERLIELLNRITYRYAPERGVTATYIATILDAQGVVAPDRSEEYEKCGAVKPGWRTYPSSSKAYRCTKPKGHDGQHGYAGVFWGGADD